MMIKNIELTTVLSTLADEINLKVLAFLSLYDELCVCDLQSLTLTTQSNISRHLKALHDVDLISVRKDGRWRYYRLNKLPEFANEIVKIAIDEYKIKHEYKPNVCEKLDKTTKELKK